MAVSTPKRRWFVRGHYNFQVVYIKCQQCNSHRFRAVERWDRNVVQRSVGLVPEHERQIAHSYWLRFGVKSLGFTTKSQISESQHIKTTVHSILNTHTGHKSLRFPDPKICRFGTLWCNRNHPSSKAWLSHPGATQDGIRPKISGKALRWFLFGSLKRYHQSGLHTKQQHMPKEQYFTQSIPTQLWCRMMLDACCNSFQPCSRSPSTFCPP